MMGKIALIAFAMLALLAVASAAPAPPGICHPTSSEGWLGMGYATCMAVTGVSELDCNGKGCTGYPTAACAPLAWAGWQGVTCYHETSYPISTVCGVDFCCESSVNCASSPPDETFPGGLQHICLPRGCYYETELCGSANPPSTGGMCEGGSGECMAKGCTWGTGNDISLIAPPTDMQYPPVQPQGMETMVNSVYAFEGYPTDLFAISIIPVYTDDGSDDHHPTSSVPVETYYKVRLISDTNALLYESPSWEYVTTTTSSSSNEYWIPDFQPSALYSGPATDLECGNMEFLFVNLENHGNVNYYSSGVYTWAPFSPFLNTLPCGVPNNAPTMPTTPVLTPTPAYPTTILQSSDATGTSTDPDLTGPPPITYGYKFFRNAAVAQNSPARTFDCPTIGCVSGDVIFVRATACDGAGACNESLDSNSITLQASGPAGPASGEWIAYSVMALVAGFTLISLLYMADKLFDMGR